MHTRATHPVSRATLAMNDDGGFETMMTIPEFAIAELFGGPTPVFTFPVDIPTQTNSEFAFAAGPGEVGASNRFELLEADEPAILPVIETTPPLPTSESHAQKPKKSYSARKPRAKFERKNRKPITSGNNDVGKKGKERCALCRKRHWKCVFTSLDSPCELCRDVGSEEPCIKTWGPKTSETIETSRRKISMFETPTSNSVTRTSNPSLSQSDETEDVSVPFASLDLSRPITVYDSSIDPVDLHILQQAFERFTDPSQGVLVARLIPKFALAYGLSISHPSLRCAIVLYCGPMWPEFSDSDRIAQLRRGACRALGRRLKRPDVLDEGDLFAAFFLASYFYNSGYDELFRYVKGFFAIARRLFDVTERSITTSQFQLFWRMLIYDISTWAGIDLSTLIPQASKFRLTPSHYREWCRTLGLPSDEKQLPVFMSYSYFATLKAIYKETRMLEQNDLRAIKDIEAHLANTDEPYSYWCFEYFMVKQWKLHPQSEVVWFSDLLNYNWCCLLIGVLPPSSDKLNFPIVAETRVFTFFSRIEYCVERLEAWLVSEEEVLALPGRDETQEPYDLMFYEVRLRLYYVRWCRKRIVEELTTFCSVHHDLVHSLLVDVIDKIPIPTHDGRPGWLTAAFLNHFGWNSYGNRQEQVVYQEIVAG